MASTEEFRAKISEASLAGEEFYKLFYENVDKKRIVIGKMYEDSATLIWNGHAVKGSGEILKFFENLPISEHNITCVNAVPLLGALTPNQTTIVVTVFGSVRFGDKENESKSFYQTFTLSSHSTVWKITSDTFRFLA